MKTSRAFTYLLVSIFSVLLLTGTAVAAESGGIQETQIIRGVFGAAGETTEFQISDGGTLLVENDKLGRSLAMSAELLDADRVLMTIRELGTGVGEKRLTDGILVEQVELTLGADLEATRSGFSLSISGVSVERRPVPANLPTKAIEEVGGSSCCVTCGGWRVCCYPAPGWCCDVTSSCGTSCSACSGGPGQE